MIFNKIFSIFFVYNHFYYHYHGFALSVTTLCYDEKILVHTTSKIMNKHVLSETYLLFVYQQLNNFRV